MSMLWAVAMLAMLAPAPPSPLFGELCAPCHGPVGRGDGPAAALFQPPPRDLARGERKFGTTAAQLAGFLVVGSPTTGMPSFAALPEADRRALAEAIVAIRERPETPASPAAFQPWPSRPLPPLPELPPGTPPILASESAAQCGRCHPAQAATWQASRHALAFGAAVSLQLGTPPDPACTACHAPLDTQQTDGGLRSEGVTCAACHRRGTEKLSARAPSGLHSSGLLVRVEAVMGGAELCLPCHSQPASQAVAGRPLLDTWREWAASPYLPARIPCQTCHFPFGDHTLRGAHDPEGVRRAVTLRFVDATHVAVRNVGAGHDFPTTATPRAVVRVRQLDLQGTPLPGTEQSWAIGRTVEPPAAPDGPWREMGDSRVPPGETRTFEYTVGSRDGTRRLEAELFFYPDWLYGRILTARAALDPRFADVARDAVNSGFRVTGSRWDPSAAP